MAAKSNMEIPQYDYVSAYRGNMTAVFDGRRMLTLSEWPLSLIQAYKAGVLTGQAAADAKEWVTTGTGVQATPRRHPMSHPWNMAMKNYRSPSGPVK